MKNCKPTEIQKTTTNQGIGSKNYGDLTITRIGENSPQLASGSTHHLYELADNPWIQQELKQHQTINPISHHNNESKGKMLHASTLTRI